MTWPLFCPIVAAAGFLQRTWRHLAPQGPSKFFWGGGPFIETDSPNLAFQAMTRLGYLDDSLNADLDEALLGFSQQQDQEKPSESRCPPSRQRNEQGHLAQDSWSTPGRGNVGLSPKRQQCARCWRLAGSCFLNKLHEHKFLRPCKPTQSARDCL